MATPHVQQLNAALRGIVEPALGVNGFSYDGSRAFRRVDHTLQSVEIVHFQLGLRYMAGKFTVNLGVMHKSGSVEIGFMQAYPHHCLPADRVRLGCILPPRVRFLSNIPLIGTVFGGRDRWWRFTDDPALTSRQVSLVTGLIIDHGLAWFELKNMK